MSILLIVSVLLPILGGIALFGFKPKETQARVISLSAVILTSLTVFSILIWGGQEKLSLVRFSPALSFGLRLDGLGKFFAGMIAFLWVFAILYTFVYMKHEERRLQYYGFYVMTYGVVLGIAFAENALTLYVFYELLTFITLPLITHTATREARRAGRMYLYYSLSGSSLALAGIVIFTVTAGTCSFEAGGWEFADSGLTLLAYLLIFLGFGVKAAIFPLCRWLPTASAAPTPTTALLHAVAVVKSGAFAILRMTYFLCPLGLLRGSWAQKVAVILAAMTVVYGSCMALKEQHFKRRFAYSTVSNLSYILLGALLLTPGGLEASLLHFLMHSVTKIGIFFCVGAIIETNRATYVYELNGMGKKAPLIFLFYTVSGLSLIGIPPFCGFLSKYYLLSSALEEGGAVGYIGVGAIICSAILTAVYVFSVSFRAFFRAPGKLSLPVAERSREPEKGFLAVTGFFAAVSLLLGLFGNGIVNLICEIAKGAAG